MKRRNKMIAAIIALNMVSAIAVSPITTKAEANYKDVESSVSLALSEKSFYYYNMAYAKILALPDGAEKTELLSQLSTISSTVWTKDITEIVNLFEVMAKEKSGREYDALQSKIKDSNINKVDQDYLYSELYSWGTNTVWTDDYKKAVAATVKVWEDKTEVSATAAEKAIAELKVQANKEYLTEQLTEAKVAVGLAPLTLDAKAFAAAKDVYVGDGKSVSIDLSKETTARTVTLKGQIKDLTINAPLATVVLEDVEVNEINVTDIAPDSLHLKGKTKVKKLFVNDKSDNARIVLEGKATIAAAEVKSGAKIEVKTDADIKNPIANLAINTDTKKVVELAGDFKDSVVQVQKAVELKVAAILLRVEVAKDAKDALITVAKDAKVAEVKSDAAIKVDGQGSVGKTSGTGSVSNSTAGSGGGGGGSKQNNRTTPAAPDVKADDASNTIVGITDKMEYAVGDATTYTAYTGATLNFAGSQKVRVRVKAVFGVSYASADTVVNFTENTYDLKVNLNGEEYSIVKDQKDKTVAALYDDVLTVLELSTIIPDVNTKLSDAIAKLKDINVAGAKKNLLEYIISAKPSSQLAGFLSQDDPDAAAILDYLHDKGLQGVYDALGEDFTVPKFKEDVQVVVKGFTEKTYAEGEKVAVAELEAVLGITKDTKLSELIKKNFSVTVVYGTDSNRTYGVKAENGVVTIKTANGGTYTLTLTTK